MNKQKLTCFLPCRKGSERIPQKNIKPFAGFEFGMIEIKLKQLIESSRVDEIMLSTNDDCILEYASSLKCEKIRLHKRSEALSSSSTSTDELVAHAASLIHEGDILWTHVTSPFLTADHYNDIISLYYQKISEGHDSLMTTTLLHSFLWDQKQPLNYDRNVEKWPRTQTLEAIHEINSGAFIASTEIYKKLDDRIGKKPYLHPLDKLVSHDIDWPEDFTVAECLIDRGLVRV